MSHADLTLDRVQELTAIKMHSDRKDKVKLKTEDSNEQGDQSMQQPHSLSPNDSAGIAHINVPRKYSTE